MFRKGGGCAPEICLFVPNLYPGKACWSMWSLVYCLAFLSTLEPGAPTAPCLSGVRMERKSVSAQLFDGMSLPKPNKSALIVLCAYMLMIWEGLIQAKSSLRKVPPLNVYIADFIHQVTVDIMDHLLLPWPTSIIKKGHCWRVVQNDEMN